MEVEADNSTVLFSLKVLRKTYESNSNVVTSSVGISYTSIFCLELAGDLAFLKLINKAWETSSSPELIEG